MPPPGTSSRVRCVNLGVHACVTLGVLLHLKAGACRPPRAHLAAQQRAFNHFRALYNDERPHASLGGQTPSSRYSPSPRPFPARLPPLEYPGHFLVKRVTNAGTFRLKHQLLFIANPLQQHHIGLDQTGEGIWSIYCGTVLLAKIDQRDLVIRD